LSKNIKTKASNLEVIIGGSDFLEIPLSGKEVQLSNRGSIITLLDSSGLKVDGVSYTKKQVSEQGWTIVF